MATYLELAEITEENGWGDFFSKTVTATQVKAAAIIDSTSPSSVALDWAKECLKTPRQSALDLVAYVIVSNNGISIAQILGASDGAIQSNIDSAVDALYP